MIRTERLGNAFQYRDVLIADTEAELLASTPGTEIAEGYAKDTGINAAWVQGKGWKVGGATKNPDGSIAMSGPLRVGGDVEAGGASFAGSLNVAGGVAADSAYFAGQVAADSASFAGQVVADSASFAGTVRVAGGVVADSGASVMRRVTPVAQWCAHPAKIPDSPSTIFNATSQINILSPVDEWTHIQVELENNNTTAYSGFRNLIAALSNSLYTIAPAVGSDVTDNPRTGWVNVAASPVIPARPGSLGEGYGTWRSDRIYLPSSYVAKPAALRNKVICLRYWTAETNAPYRYLQNGNADGAAIPTSDMLGNWSRAKRITERTTNEDCVAGTASAANALLEAATEGGSTNIMRVYFWNGPVLVGDISTRIGVEVCGASTMSVARDAPSGGAPWIGLANALTRPLGITHGYSARGSSTTAQYLAAAKTRLDVTPNHYALYPVFALNDTDATTEAVMIAQARRFFEFSEYAFGKNVIPVAVLFPHDGMNAESYGYREAACQIVLGSGLAVFDARQILGSPANRNAFVATNTVDGTHISDAGADILSQAYFDAIQKIIAAHPPLK